MKRLLRRVRVWIGHCLADQSLLDYALDGMEGEARLRAQEHLAVCGYCQERLRPLMELQDAMASQSGREAASDGLAERIIASRPKPPGNA